MIGSGPGGQRAALQGAKAGKRVALIERCDELGGSCVHVGTLPSKSFRESVYRWSLSTSRVSGKTGAKAPLPDMARLLERCKRVVSGESRVIRHQLERNKVTIFKGHARLRGRNEVEVEGKKKDALLLRAPYIMIATGAKPVAPAHLGVDGKVVHDSDTILGIKKLPRSLVVLGAGIIGCEYASIFATAGTQVYLVDKRDAIISWADREIIEHLVERFTQQKMQLLLGVEATQVVRARKSGKKGKKTPPLTVELTNGQKIRAECVLIAMGRQGCTEDLALENAGVRLGERGLIPVDKDFRTNVPSIYAVGDVIGPPGLASTALEQGRMAACHAFGLEHADLSAFFPTGIYTIPEISMVGKTEEELAAAGVDFVVGRARYRELARGQIVGDRWGILKLCVDRKTLKLLGVHIMGDAAANLVHIGQTVMALGGDLNYFIHTVFNYPTLAEAYKTAAFHAINQLRGTTTTK